MPSPCSPLLGDLQTVQVRLLLPTSPSRPLRLDVGGQEGPRGVAGVRRVPLAVMLRVPVIGRVVGVLEAAVLMGDCEGGDARCVQTSKPGTELGRIG